jgi:hypothetical protein
MAPEESFDSGPLLARLYAAIKRAVGAVRIYTLITLEGATHFYAWLIRRARCPSAGRRLSGDRSALRRG